MLPQTLFYIFHIYTRPKFTKPTFTQNQDLHKLKFTQLRFTHTHKFTQPHIGIPKFTQLKFIPNWTQIYKDTNLHCAKLCKVQNWVECKLF